MKLVGHLTSAALEETLTKVETEVALCAGMLVDCSKMTGYDADARAYFVAWHRRKAEGIEGVAVVTRKPLWRLVISAMALASGQRMKAFDDVKSADRWLGALAPRISVA